MEPDDAKPGNAAVHRALGILRCFADGAPERRLSDLARQAGVSVSTAHRLLAALVAEGFLVQNADDERYRLGPTLVALGQRGAHDAGWDATRDVLVALTEATGESASIAVRSGTDALVMVLSASPQRLRFDHGVGSRIALHASAMGKVLMAFSGRPPADEVVSLGRLEAFTEHTVTDPAVLVAQLVEVRERGWARNREERYREVAGIAAPVFGPHGELRGALGLQGPTGRFDAVPESERAAQVVAAAQEAGARLP